MGKIAFIIICFCIDFIYSNHSLCIVSLENRDIYRNDYTYPESIQSENFVIHFTTSVADSQFVNNQWMNLQSNTGFAQSILDLSELALIQYIEDGWETPPPDCDENIDDLESPDHCIYFGGNSLYDIYIANDAAGMVVPERPYPVEPYTGGYTSYMKISTFLNAYDSLPSWAEHVIAHELHHAIQMRYGYSVSGTPGNYIFNGWFFEQTASYMENVIFPNNIHLLTMLSNCNVTSPLTFPEYGIDYPADLYQYRSALWQKYLVEAYNDSTIIRKLWENYGIEYANGEPVSLFPIYNNALNEATNGNVILSEAFDEYALWRYFTGERNNPNLNYFNQGASYCASNISILQDSLYTFYTNTGGVYYFELDEEINNLRITSLNFNDIISTLLLVNSNNNISTIDLPILNENSTFYFDEYSDYNKILIVGSNYIEPISELINFEISLNNMNFLGDINSDGIINVNDVVLIINYILQYDNFDDETLLNADINADSQINIMDVVLLVNIILSN